MADRDAAAAVDAGLDGRPARPGAPRDDRPAGAAREEAAGGAHGGVAPGSGGPAGAIDSQRMFEATARLPEQVAEAASSMLGLAGLPDHESIENVVVLGMGGSGIAGDVLLSVAAPFMAVPVVVAKSYTPPAFVGSGTLVFAISFSGNTEETVEAATEAAGQGGRLVVVAGGGKLAELAQRFEAHLIPVPNDIPQPRAAIGAMAVPPLLVLEQVGLFPGASHWIARAVEQLRRRSDELVAPHGPAELLAARIGETIPLVHSSGSLGATAAQRWKNQVNENAKSPAFYGSLPETCHNDVQGWERLVELTRRAITLVHLRHDGEHPQLARRFELCSDAMRASVAGVEEVVAEGEGPLAQLLDLMLFGDFVSLYLARDAGIDPGPIPVLSRIKARLAEGH
ncbi:MAG: bifunctional phosphoglucose/phosphomannose isomerase [Acidimicrobiales bacterium]